jgi:hypothetical protein
MNETHKPSILASQHYLYEVSGQAVVGYFPWRESVIVVEFDASRGASRGECVDPDYIRHNSSVRLKSVEEARRDWIWRERNTGDTHSLQWCRVLAIPNFHEIEGHLRIVCSGLAIGFRDQEEARTDPVDDNTEKFTTVLDRIIKQMKVENKTSPVIQEYPNYNYPMEA